MDITLDFKYSINLNENTLRDLWDIHGDGGEMPQSEEKWEAWLDNTFDFFDLDEVADGTSIDYLYEC